MKRIALVVVTLVVLVLVGARLRSPVQAVSWNPPPAVAFDGPFASNSRLQGLEWWAKQLRGPEAILIEPDGTLLTGLADGRIVRLRPGSDAESLLVDTKGRPLAMARHPDGRLIICDAHRGLLALDARGALEVLSTEQGGVPFHFVDDVAITADGTVYFTDASAHFTVEDYKLELLEHQLTGRVLRYDVRSKTTSLVVGGFNLANGITLSPDEQSVIVAETGAYQLWRVFIDPARFGQKERFGPTLPGFPDNLRFSPSRQVYWVAVGAPRDPIVDALAEWPQLRAVIAGLPEFVQPAPVRHATVVAFDLEGRVVETLRYRGADAYSPIASVLEHDGFLYLGSFERGGVARVKL